ncbi:hypothetical protein BHE74_00026065 [Ensete ventricosum]|nr:hypothetical protein BHE74_00026065 [Ensete ventricosum]
MHCDQGSDDAVGNSPGVRGELVEDIGRLDDAVGAHWEFARRFVEGIGKLTRNIPGDHQRKTVRLAVGDSGACRNTGVSERRLDRPYPGYRATTNSYWRVNRLGPTGKPLIPDFWATDGG